MDNLRRRANELVVVLPEKYRAIWLNWTADLIDCLVDLDARIIDLRTSMRELSERITVVIHDAVRDASTGQELRIAALDEYVHAEVQTLTDRVRAIHDQITIMTSIIEAQIQRQDAQHVQILAEMARLYDRIQKLRSQSRDAPDVS